MSRIGSVDVPFEIAHRQPGERVSESPCGRHELFSGYPDVMSTRKAAEALDTNERTLREMARDGRIRSVRIGRVYKFTKTALLSFVERGCSDDGRRSQ
jgi:excisionase family DNA binding protein